MLSDAAEIEPGTRLSAAVCVVGAGAAGICAALDLARRGADVILLESGGLEYDAATQDMNRGEVSGLPYYDLESTRLRYLGGTTNHWSGWSRPLDPIDFEARPYLPGSGWPIGAATLAPYYPRACDYCELDTHGFAAEDHAEDTPGLMAATRPTPGLETKVWKRSPPTRFGERYRDALRTTPSLRVLLHATAVELESNENGAAVTAVIAARPDGGRFGVGARHVVLAAGGIETPRLMLASRQRAPQGVGNAHDQVGRYFMLHPQIDIGDVLIKLGQSPLLLQDRVEGRKQMIRAGFTLAPEVQRAQGLPNHAILFRPGAVDDRSSFKHRLRELKGRLLDDDLAWPMRGVLADLAAGARHEDAARWVRVQLRMDHVPHADSRVRLASARDALGVPRVNLDWQTTPGEFDAVRRSARLFGAGLGALGAGRLHLSPWVTSDAQDWPDDAEWDFHHLGATRMHADPRQGVVDANCTVHGVGNLHVASSSVFTTAGFANPTLTIVALALRLAERLGEALRP